MVEKAGLSMCGKVENIQSGWWLGTCHNIFYQKNIRHQHTLEARQWNKVYWKGRLHYTFVKDVPCLEIYPKSLAFLYETCLPHISKYRQQLSNTGYVIDWRLSFYRMISIRNILYAESRNWNQIQKERPFVLSKLYNCGSANCFLVFVFSVQWCWEERNHCCLPGKRFSTFYLYILLTYVLLFCKYQYTCIQPGMLCRCGCHDDFIWCKVYRMQATAYSFYLSAVVNCYLDTDRFYT